jgi:hypothetical protein
MIEAVLWPLFVVTIWAGVFVLTVLLVRSFIREHDREAEAELADTLPEEAPAEARYGERQPA